MDQPSAPDLHCQGGNAFPAVALSLPADGHLHPDHLHLAARDAPVDGFPDAKKNRMGVLPHAVFLRPERILSPDLLQWHL